MKYLFINSVAGFGSTGRIAAEKCRELMAQGHECVLAYGRQKANCDGIPTVSIGTALDYRLHALRNRLLDDQGFGSRAATRRFLEWVKQYDPDVIWLHNVHGYYLHIGEFFGYLRTCGKRIFWTLHDCWSFTGHCAYYDFAGCDRWKTGCHHCPQKGSYPKSCLRDNSRRNFEKKKALFAGIPDLTLIVPSHWLESQVWESFLKDYPVEVVYNTVNTDIFRPTPSGFRREHGLEDQKIILGVASVWDARKGLKDFVALAGLLEEGYRIVLIGLTQQQIRTLPGSILALPRTSRPQELAAVYSAADWFVNPTYEENYPTVNLEARACGVRVICYDSGGSKETLGENDVLVTKGDLNGLLDAIYERN